MARKMLVNLHCLQKAEQVVLHENIKAPNSHHEALGALDQLSEIAGAIEFAALAVIGMAEELGTKEGYLLANHLRDQAEMIRKASEQLLPNRILSACRANPLGE